MKPMEGTGIISPDSYITDLVKSDHRTAIVFRKYGINYCCGGKWPLQVICDGLGIDSRSVIEELTQITNTSRLPHSIPYHEWDLGFLTHFISKVYLEFIYKRLPETRMILAEFAEKHAMKYPFLTAIGMELNKINDLVTREGIEVEQAFQYIRQLENAYNERHKNDYGILLVRALNKPLVQVWEKRKKELQSSLDAIRDSTNQFIAPANACTSHAVVYGQLKELDEVMAQFIFLSCDVLLPKAINIQREMVS